MYIYEYKYLTREMIDNVEVHVERENTDLLYEIRKYNSTLSECKHNKKIVDSIRYGYILYHIIISLVLMIINLNGERSPYVFIGTAIYGVGMIVLTVIRQNFEPKIHGILSAFLLIAGWNYIFIIPINIGVCILYNKKHLELMLMYGYPHFNEVKMIMLSKETVELMRVHEQGQNYLTNETWNEHYQL